MSKYFYLALLVFLLGCEKDPAEEEKIFFTGLSMTDVNGQALSIDQSDWRLDDIWKEKEKDLFSTELNASCSLPFNYHIIAYPNPCTDYLSFHVAKDSNSSLQLRLVDEDFNVIVSYDTLNIDNIIFDVRSWGIQDTIRLYYKFINDNCEFRGHGDILIQ